MNQAEFDENFARLTDAEKKMVALIVWVKLPHKSLRSVALQKLASEKRLRRLRTILESNGRKELNAVLEVNSLPLFSNINPKPKSWETAPPQL